MNKKSTKPAAANAFASSIAGIKTSVSAIFDSEAGESFPVDIDLIDVKQQDREEFEDDENSLQELAESIKELGVISPIYLRIVGERYELVAGERRLRASKLVGRKTISALARELSDEQVRLIQFAENIQRKNLTNLELARRLGEDLAALGSIDAVMEKHKKSRSWVSKILSLNNLPEQAQRLVSEGVTSDMAIISDVRQIEARDPEAAKALVDDLKENLGKGDSRAKVERVRNKVKPAKNEAKAVSNDLASLYVEVKNGDDAKVLAAGLTTEQKKACDELRVCFEQGKKTTKPGTIIFQGFDNKFFGSSGAGALRLAAFLRGVDAGESGRFQVADVFKLVQVQAT